MYRHTVESMLYICGPKAKQYKNPNRLLTQTLFCLCILIPNIICVNIKITDCTNDINLRLVVDFDIPLQN